MSSSACRYSGPVESKAPEVSKIHLLDITYVENNENSSSVLKAVHESAYSRCWGHLLSGPGVGHLHQQWDLWEEATLFNVEAQ